MNLPPGRPLGLRVPLCAQTAGNGCGPLSSGPLRAALRQCGSAGVSYSLTQWDCKARGAEFYADPVQTRRAQLVAELEQIDRGQAA